MRKMLLPATAAAFAILYLFSHAQAATPQVAAGFWHTVGLKSDGSVVAVGDNTYGQLEVSGWSSIVQVSAGHSHTVGLKSDGSVVATDCYDLEPCYGNGWSGVVQVSAGAYNTVGLKSDGTVIAVGENESGQLETSGWLGIIQVSTGYGHTAHGHTVGLKSDGSVVAVGDNTYGQLEVSGWSDIVQVAAGHFHTVGLKSDGSLVAVGQNDFGQCSVNGWSGIVQVSAGAYFTIGLKSDGSVVAVGYNTSGNLDVGGWSDIVQVAAGQIHTVGLKSNGNVVAVGSNGQGQTKVGAWIELLQVSAGGLHTVGLRSDGTVLAIGDNEFNQLNVDEWSGVVQVSAGAYDTVGLKSDGSVVAVGDNTNGQLEVSGWLGVVQVSAGLSHTVGLMQDGSVVAVGYNWDGECDVSGWSGLVQVAAGGLHTVGLKLDGSVVAVGNNGDGACNVTGWSGVVQVAAGTGHTVGLKADGKVLAVGNNEYGQLNVADWSSIVRVVAGHAHTVGLKTDGTVVAVGNNWYNQLEVQEWSSIIKIAAGGAHTVGLKADGRVVAVGSNVNGQRSFFDKLSQPQFLSLKINSPNGGEVLTKGQESAITWDSQNVTGAIQIDLYKGGSTPQFFVRQLAASAPNTGTYPFSPPIYLAPGNDYLIGISAENGTIFDFSDSSFTIQSQDVFQPSSFSFSEITSPQSMDVPFQLTITAKDIAGNQLTTFNGEVTLYCPVPISPISVSLVNGIWTGNIVLLDGGKNLSITATSKGISGTSNKFSTTSIGTGAISGIAKDNRNTVLQNAIIHITDSLTGADVYPPVITNENGIYSFENIPAGTYYISAEYEGKVSSWSLCYISANSIIFMSPSIVPIFSSAQRPVVLVPGMMGSTLKGESGWVTPRLKKDYATLEDLELFEKAGRPGWNNLKEYLKTAKGLEGGSTIIDSPWDWRVPLEFAYKEYLMRAIDLAKGINPYEKVNIIAHSMGGLLVRQYIQSDDYSARNDIENFTMIGTPNEGSANAYYIWEGGDPLKVDNITGNDPFNVYFNTIEALYEITYDKGKLPHNDVESHAKIREFLSGPTNEKTGIAPSLRQLLPTYAFLRDKNENIQIIESSDSENEFLIGLNTDSRRLERMSPPSGNKIKTRVYYSDTKDTIGNIDVEKVATNLPFPYNFYPDGRPTKDPALSAIGDGTVPAQSACLPFDEGWADCIQRDASHTTLIKDFYANIADNLYVNATQSLFSLNKNSLTSQDSTDQDVIDGKLLFSVKGRVQPQITDPQSRSTGINPSNGAIVNTIPSAELKIESNRSLVTIYNPIDGNYSISLKSLFNEDCLISVAYTTPTGESVVKSALFCNQNLLTISLNLMGGSQVPIVIMHQPESPTGLKADSVVQEGLKTKLSWNANTNLDISGYKIYARYIDEPFLKPIGISTTTSFFTGDSWSGDSNSRKRLYSISVVSTDGSESFLSEFVANDDMDHDGLPDYIEIQLGTYVDDPDSDGDSWDDGEEILKGTDPLDPESSPCLGDSEPDGDVDGSDLFELIAGSNSVDIEKFAASFGRVGCH